MKLSTVIDKPTLECLKELSLRMPNTPRPEIIQRAILIYHGVVFLTHSIPEDIQVVRKPEEENKELQAVILSRIAETCLSLRKQSLRYIMTDKILGAYSERDILRESGNLLKQGRIKDIKNLKRGSGLYLSGVLE